MKAVRKRRDNVSQSSSGNAGAVDNGNPVLLNPTSLPGLKRTAWASEAPSARREQITEVLQAMRVDPQSAFETVETAAAQPHQNVSRKRARFLRMKARRGTKEKTMSEGFTNGPSGDDRRRENSRGRGRGRRFTRGRGRDRGCR